MKIQKRNFFVGGRVFKTGISVFITALICHLLHWPSMFAVITAIVTIEPTAADSIKKAFVRFPAAAIGAAFSVIFTFLFGDSPLSYTFVAVCTIVACYKLKLQDGMLVATLTGVAMITTVHDQYISSFFIRLGTTGTGIIVSSLVNIFVLPPNYSQAVSDGIHKVSVKIGEILSQKISEKTVCEKELQIAFDKLVKDIERMQHLCQYQKEEWRFHPSNRIRHDIYEQKKLTTIQQITYHVGNIMYRPSLNLNLDKDKEECLISALQTLSKILSNDYMITNEDHLLFQELTEWFYRHPSQQSREIQQMETHTISSETAVLYELLSIFDLTVELNHIQKQENRHSN
jgi:uncharacterized membrane protein YgaE (UPF0421/DUF939 family)